MNKLRRRYNQISFPPTDNKGGNHTKGSLPGNMMGYKDSGSSPKTSHTQGAMPGNMMAYPASRNPSSFPPISDESKNYGPKPLNDPTSAHREGPTPKRGV